MLVEFDSLFLTATDIKFNDQDCSKQKVKSVQRVKFDQEKLCTSDKKFWSNMHILILSHF